MKLVKLSLLALVLCLNIGTILNGMVVCLNGSSCSGKSTISEVFMDIAESNACGSWQAVAMDDFEIRSSSPLNFDKKAIGMVVIPIPDQRVRKN